jgi:hypothetical protein
MTPVSHTEGNRATTQARGETGVLARPNQAREGTGDVARPAPKTEHFPCSGVIAPIPRPCQSSSMLGKLLLILVTLCLVWSECAAVPKPHVITFGKWISAKWPNATGQKLLDLKVRPLFVDTRLKEYTTGIPHELTDRPFLVRRALRVNDALPTESASAKPRAGNGNAAAGCSSTVSPDESPSSTCPSSIPSIRPQAGIATTSPTAASPKTARNFTRSSLR